MLAVAAAFRFDLLQDHQERRIRVFLDLDRDVGHQLRELEGKTVERLGDDDAEVNAGAVYVFSRNEGGTDAWGRRGLVDAGGLAQNGLTMGNAVALEGDQPRIDGFVFQPRAQRVEDAQGRVHDLRPDAVTIAEDVSGMPGLAAPVGQGGCGFDFRLAMGVTDCWVKLVRDVRDEELGNQVDASVGCAEQRGDPTGLERTEVHTVGVGLEDRQGDPLGIGPEVVECGNVVRLTELLVPEGNRGEARVPGYRPDQSPS